MSRMTISGQAANFALSLAPADVPAPVMHAAKLHALDAIGCALAGYGLDAARGPRGAMLEAGGRPESATIGSSQRLPAENAAFVNAALAHTLDYDDTHPASVCHVSAAVAPAAIAAAEREGARGDELLTAIVIGNEVLTRLGMAAPGAFHAQGYHPTGVCGIFGAIAACARLRGLDAAQTMNAMGIGGSFAAGIFEYLEDGSETKPLHPAWAGHAALQACRLAAHGATGPATVFEGRFGLYSTFLSLTNVDLAGQFVDLGERWETLAIAYKPYPACHFMHSCLDATAELIRSTTVEADDIAVIDATVPGEVLPIVVEPADAKVAPRTAYDAKFSLPFSIAALVVHGRVGVDTYTDDALIDPAVLRLAARVQGRGASYQSYPASFPGAVEIRLRTGERLATEVIHQRGGTTNPMSDAQISQKFSDNAALALHDEARDRLQRAILELEQVEDVKTAFEPLTEARVGAAVPA